MKKGVGKGGRREEREEPYEPSIATVVCTTRALHPENETYRPRRELTNLDEA